MNKMNNKYHAKQDIATPTQAKLPLLPILKKRSSKRDSIQALFIKKIGVHFPSPYLHELFGSALRTRISEINRDPEAMIIIRNAVSAQSDGTECSVYWAEAREALGNGR